MKKVLIVEDTVVKINAAREQFKGKEDEFKIFTAMRVSDADRVMKTEVLDIVMVDLYMSEASHEGRFPLGPVIALNAINLGVNKVYLMPDRDQDHYGYISGILDLFRGERLKVVAPIHTYKKWINEKEWYALLTGEKR